MSHPPPFTIQSVLSQESTKTSKLAFSEDHKPANEGVQLAAQAQGVLQPSFICAILGHPGSGKSTVIQEFLLNQSFYGKKFQRVLFVGPTKYGKLIQDEFNWKKVLDIGWIYRQIEQCEQWQCGSLLIVLDDLVASIKTCAQVPDFVSLFYNRRHLMKSGVISFLLTSQKWNLLPTFIRSAINMLIVFPLGLQQVEVLTKEVSIGLPRKSMIAILVALKKHQFVYINSATNKLYTDKWVQM